MPNLLSSAEPKRVTPMDEGGIAHRGGTVLTPPRRCRNGHIAPRYANSNACVVCVRLAGVRNSPPRRPRARLHRFVTYAEARDWHEQAGGWLLDLGGGTFGCTDREKTVARWRGPAWVDRCETLGMWDEVEIAEAERRRQARG